MDHVVLFLATWIIKIVKDYDWEKLVIYNPTFISDGTHFNIKLGERESKLLEYYRWRMNSVTLKNNLSKLGG